MKKNLSIIGLVLLFLLGIFITLYPFISNYQYEHSQEKIIVDYQQVVDNSEGQRLEEERRAAEEYNKNLLMGNVIQRDPFDPEVIKTISDNYHSILNLKGDGTLGYIEIPKIKVYLAMYHGTEEEVLQKGIGHLENSSLPIGGTGTHSVVSAHTGLSDKKLFSDLSYLIEGDVFYLYVLGEVLAYKVDQIKIVEPYDTGDLRISPEEDYVTLVTCHPYGINSHRLLVRGSRIEYQEAKEVEVVTNDIKIGSSWLVEYKKALTWGIGSILSIFIVYMVAIRLIARRNRRN